MLGMLGIIVQNNEIKNTIQIMQEIKLGEKYLVKFLNAPTFNRVCNTEEIQTWLLFATQEEANSWVASSQKPPPEATAPAGAGKNGAGEGIPAKNLSPDDGDGAPYPPEVEDDDEPVPAEIIPAQPVVPRSAESAVEPVTPELHRKKKRIQR